MSSLTLERFMIFNASEGRSESREQDKLLYHWTKGAPNFEASPEEQIDDVCLCDASVNVTEQLACDPIQRQDNAETKTNQDQPAQPKHKCLNLIFTNTLIVVVEVEPSQSIWMAAHVRASLQGLEQVQASSRLIQDSSSNDSVPIEPQYADPNLIPADAVHRVINNIYSRFCLLNGTFSMIRDELRANQPSSSAHNESQSDRQLRTVTRNTYRTICQQYFAKVLPEMHLSSILSNLAQLYDYIMYLDLQPLTLMRVNSFVNHLVCVDATKIRHSIVIFNDRLLSSSMSLSDTRLVYNYLVSVLIRDSLQEELSKEVDKVRRLADNLPLYLSDSRQLELSPPDMSSVSGQDAVCSSSHELEPQLDKRPSKYYMTVFRSSNDLTLALLLTDPNCDELLLSCEHILTRDARLGVVPLTSLAQTVGQSFLQRATSSYQGATGGGGKAAKSASSASSASGTGQLVSPGGSTVSAPSIRSAEPAEPPAKPVYLRPQLASALMSLSQQKCIIMDTVDMSVGWPLNRLDASKAKEQAIGTHFSATSGNFCNSLAGGERLRLVRCLVELEPEVQRLGWLARRRVVELFAKTINDCWLSITNSRYRSIYSLNKAKNCGLSEAQQSAIDVKTSLFGNRA